MIIADASVWIDHFRSPNAELEGFLNRKAVLMHPFVFGELALGNLPNRRSTLDALGDLIRAPEASHAEAMRLLSSHDLAGRGIGYVDLHLLAAALLQPGLRLWTRDRRLAALAETLGAGFAIGGSA